MESTATMAPSVTLDRVRDGTSNLSKYSCAKGTWPVSLPLRYPQPSLTHGSHTLWSTTPAPPTSGEPPFPFCRPVGPMWRLIACGATSGCGCTPSCTMTSSRGSSRGRGSRGTTCSGIPLCPCTYPGPSPSPTPDQEHRYADKAPGYGAFPRPQGGGGGGPPPTPPPGGVGP